MTDYTILHHGAVEGVTGSCHELRLADGRSVLVDCGLFQGAEAGDDGAGAQRLEIGFAVDGVQALVVTHVHIDHVGRIPYLLAAGFRGPILCSEASARLLPLVLEDALRVGVTRNERLIDQVLGQVASQVVALPYGRWHELVPHWAVKLHPAGHILGSAFVEMRLDGPLVRGAADGRRHVLFSGDLGATHTPLLPAPRSPWRADELVLESTYGDRNHEGRRGRVRALRRVIERALRDGGTVIFPAFSIGRTQELLYELEELIRRHAGQPAAHGLPWEDLEIIVDSPLAARMTRAYRELRRFWDREAKRRLRQGRHPLAFEQIYTVDDHQSHLRTVDYLARSGRPAVVIAASGMCAGGRVVNYLKAMLTDPRHDVVFVGYQAAGTPGADIQKYGPRGGWVDLDGERITIRAGVHTLSGYSAHADQRGLLRFVRRMRHRPERIRLVHGDVGARKALAALLRAELPECEVLVGQAG